MRQHYLFIFLLVGLLILLCALCACGNAQAPIPVQTSANTNAQESSASINTDTDVAPKGIILIDPGHGFDDPGCMAYNGSFTEAQITQAVAGLLQEELASRGWHVELTHDGKHMPDAELLYESARKMPVRNDINVNPQEWVCNNNLFSKYERVLYANARSRETPVILFFSLHVNFVETSAQMVRGFEIDYYKDHPHATTARSFSETLSRILADTFHQKVKLFADNKKEAFVVTKYTDMPSVLLEMGYASNTEDAALLASVKFQARLVQAIADAVDSIF